MRVTNYRPPPTIKRFMESNAFVKAIMGPFGSGKSVGCVMTILYHAMRQKPAEDGIRYTRFAVIRNTNRMLADTTIQTFMEWVPPNTANSKGAGVWHSSKNNFTLEFADVHCEVWFRALDNADDSRNLLSLELTGAWLNEYREISPEIFRGLMGRVGRYKGPGEKVQPTWHGIMMDSNPPPGDGFFYDFFEKPLPDELKVMEQRILDREGRPMRELFKQPSGMSAEAENVENLPANYYDMMILNNSDKGDEWVNVHVHGQYGFLTDGRPVYNGFKHAVHVSKTPMIANPHMPLAIGVDFGLTPSAVIAQQSPKGQWLILGELVTEEMGAERFAENLLQMLHRRFPDCRTYEVWGDPAGSQRAQSNEVTCFEVMRAAGFMIRPGPQDLETRIGSVQRCISRMVDGMPGIIYDPSCEMLIKGKLGLYRYRRKKTALGELDEKPEKNDASHPADAEQYVIGSYEGPALKGRAPRKWGGRPDLQQKRRTSGGPIGWKVY